MPLIPLLCEVFNMLKAENIRIAIKRSECVEIDYTGMTDEERYEIDCALDTVFQAAKECAKILEQYKEVKVIGGAE